MRAMTARPAPPEHERVAERLYQALALFQAGRMDEAETAYGEILLADPGNPHALHLLGLICTRRGDYDLGEQLVRRSVDLAPHARSWLNLGTIRAHRGDADGSIACYRTALALDPQLAEAWANLLFALDLHPQAPWTLLRATRDAFDQQVAAPLTQLAARPTNDRDPDRGRLRVGYVSADFRMSHSASLAFGWITEHDPEQVVVYLYSTLEGTDPTAAAFRARADVWSEVGHLDPLQLAEAVRGDELDILVDLAGASAGGRPLLMAMKPAPIAITGWGYPHGLGIGALDALVGDDVSIPPEHAERYREAILRLPVSIPYRVPDPVPDPSADPGPPSRPRRYGYLGRAHKLTAPTIALWARLLTEDPTGVLLLKSAQYADRQTRDRIVDGFGALGVEPWRIEIRGETSRYQHLATHREIDVALDPLVCGGGATIWDAAVMGVPTVTLPGQAVSGRQGASIMRHIGLEPFVAQTADGYIARARTPLPARETVRAATLAAVGTDPVAYCRLVEAEYRRIWQVWCRKEHHI